MATATEEKKEEGQKEEKKGTRIRRIYRLGVRLAAKEYEVPDGKKLEAVPTDWELGQHKELTADDFADTLHYFEWVQSYAASLSDAAGEKIEQLKAYGDATMRKEMTEIFGNSDAVVASVTAKLAAAKESGNEELAATIKEQFLASVANILGDD